MIFNCRVRNEFNEYKTFFLTADNKSQLYKRILSTYGIHKEKVEILEEYIETPDWGYKFFKSYVSHLTNDDIKLADKARELFSSGKRRCEPYKSDYMKRHNYLKAININDEKDLVLLLSNYKNIKVYWETSKEKMGERQYYAFVK